MNVSKINLLICFLCRKLETTGKIKQIINMAVDIGSINYFDNYAWLCNYTFKNFIISYQKWLGGPWPAHLAHPPKLALVVCKINSLCNFCHFNIFSVVI